MNQETANYIMQRMSKYLDNSQIYRFNIEKMLEKSDKNVCVMNTDDIRGYLSSYHLILET